MTFDAGELVYTGEGPLAYDSFSISVDWGNGDQDCSSGTGNPGVLGVGAMFDLNMFPASPNQVRLEVALGPEIYETTALGFIEAGQCNAGATGTTMFYVWDLMASQGTFPYSIFYYYVNLNTPVTYNFAAGTSSFGGIYQGTEQTTLTASQTQ